MMNLPKGWKNVKLDDVLEMVQYGLSQSAGESGQYPMFRMNNFREGKAIANNMVYVDLPDKEAKKFLLQPNDILFNRTNSLELVGKTGIFNLPGDYVFASYLVRLRVDETVADPRYINYFLNDDNTKSRLRLLATVGVSQCNINPTTLRKKLSLPLPPLAEQNRIATILDACDRVIEGTALLLEKQEKRKNLLAHKLFSQDSAKEVKLGEVVSRKKGKKVKLNTERIGFPYIGASSLLGNYSQFTDSTEAAFCSEKDVLILWDGENAGITATGLQGVLSTTMMALITTPNIDNYFLHYALQLDNARIRSLRTGSGIPHMPSDFLQSYKIGLPSLAKQQKIGHVLRACDKEIKLLRQQLGLLQQQKKGLMQRLLTGQSFIN